MFSDQNHIQQIVLNPISTISKKYVILVLLLLGIISFGAYAWLVQLENGLGVTGLSERVFWGVYISNFIFFIGISYSGTLVSAVLRLTQAEWRTSLTRISEVITVVGILVGFSMIFIDMGKPERVLIVPLSGRLQSPLFWDFLSVTSYLVGSMIFLYLPLIPDIALLRDLYGRRSGIVSRIRYGIYLILAAGWHGSKEQSRRLTRSISI
ncbi:MAG TPA: NrfD/PsrC family molybdoenzyme membrane anchor subunit, partial [Candidatus Hodarchaeales archaeon]|nr:NrfD/PsrC family molybdoenzyme membrane anchor subunit [Candidatus Hodarchaeales archaeon]